MKNLRMVLFPLTILVAVVLRNNLVNAVGEPDFSSLLGQTPPIPGAGVPGPGGAPAGEPDFSSLLNPGSQIPGAGPLGDETKPEVGDEDSTKPDAGAQGTPGKDTGAAGSTKPGSAEEASGGGRGRFPPILQKLLKALQQVQKKYKRS